MTLVKYAPVRPTRHRRHFAPRHGMRRTPGVNVVETNDAFLLDLAVPGLSKSQIDLQVEDDQLKIHADSTIDESIKYVRKEFDYTRFEKVFDLPETIDQTNVEAKLANGVLHVVLHKKEEAKKLPPQSIKIK